MLLLSLGGEPPFHQALLADAERLRELSAALSRLRAERAPGPIAAFFDRYAAAHERAERAIALTVSARKWQARLLEVKDFLKSRMPRNVIARETHDGYVIRKLGWVQLDRELGRARALLRIGTTEPVLSSQRERVLAAFLATSLDERHAPPPRALPDFEFWSTRYEELDPATREQLAWSQAQELVERGLELCAEPLSEPLGLGGHATLETEGEPLIARRSPAHPGWVDPSWRPEYAMGVALMELARFVRPKPGADLEAAARVEARLAEAARHAAQSGGALVWWLGPTG